MKNEEAQNPSEMGGKQQLLVMASNSNSKPAAGGKPRYDHRYPEPLAKYQDVVEDPKSFMDTLGKLHASMSTKFM